MKVLVTGVSGGLGELVVHELLRRNHQVIASSRDAEKAKSLPFYSQVKYIPFEIGTQQTQNLFEFFDRPDALIHLAWDKVNDYRSEAHENEILAAHQALLDNLIKNGLQNITVAGTCYEYGIREGILEENMPAAPVLPYPAGKNKLREHLAAQQDIYGFSWKWARIFYVFGEVKGRKNLYSLLMAAAKSGEKKFNMSGGEQIRDFLKPSEIASILVDMCLQTSVNGVINCCSGKPVKLKDYVQQFVNDNKLDLELNLGFYPYVDYEPMETWGSVSKLEKVVKSF